MSAFIVDRAHIDLLVTVALNGPRGREVNPGNAWGRLSWYATDPQAAFVEAGGGDDGWKAIQDAHRELEAYGRPGVLSPDEFGEMLWAENVKSVRARYSDADESGMVAQDFYDGYSWKRSPYVPTAVEALKAISCLEYQSCEHDDWRESETYRVLQVLKDQLVSSLPGYSEAPWEWDDAKAEEARRRQAMPPAQLAELEAQEGAERAAEAAAYYRAYSD